MLSAMLLIPLLFRIFPSSNAKATVISHALGSIIDARIDKAGSITGVHEAGRCAIYDECGSKSSFGNQLPCPDNGLARVNNDTAFRSTLESVCGTSFVNDFDRNDGIASCCTLSQLRALSSSLGQAEALLATCPACRNNFRQFYCSFTCSPNQSQFLDVTSTQNATTRLSNGTIVVRDAVKSISFHVGKKYGEGFYDSCKDVKFGATNGVAMDLIGGGAKDYQAFLRFMGQERALGGSPFQIDFPDSPSLSSSETALPPPSDPSLPQQLLASNATRISPFNPKSLNCASSSLQSRCACPDCPAVCATLPPILSPGQQYDQRCRVGLMSCFSYFLVMAYSVGLIAFLFGVGWKESRRRRGPKYGERVAWNRIKTRVSFSSIGTRWNEMMSGRSRQGYDPVSTSENLATRRSSAFDADDDDEESERGHLERNPSSSSSAPSSVDLTPSSPSLSLPLSQPRLHPLTVALSSFFYSLGYFISSHSFLVIAAALAVCGVVNLGWSSFEVERDPVKLWVAEGSQAARGKKVFDEAFGETWRSQQVFVWAHPISSSSSEVNSSYSSPSKDNAEPVLSYPVLLWWQKVELEIRALRSSPHNYTWGDVCFNPSATLAPASSSASTPASPDRSASTTADDTSCVLQSFMNYYVEDPMTESSWRGRINDCVATPASCLTPNGPMNPKLLLGGIPSQDLRELSSPQQQRADLARAFIVTYVLSTSKDDPVAHLARSIEWEETLQAYLLALSTSTDLDELGVSMTFSTGVSLEEELNKSSNTDARIVVLSYAVMFLYVALSLGKGGIVSAMGRLAKRVFGWPKVWGGHGVGFRRENEVKLMRRRTLVECKFLLGLIGISIVLLSVSTSVALFSALKIKVTLIIAEVIPFLVLAIGVDNVFILCHELERQNTRAYLTASRNGPIGGSQTASIDSNLDIIIQDQYDPDLLSSVDTRVASTLARMGPSILYSATCEATCFGLGAMVGMPAVKNFAIYAAGAVIINTLLQLSIFVSAMSIDLKRVELASTSELHTNTTEGMVSKIFRTIYAPTLLKRPIKFLVVVLFSGLFLLSWISARHIELGLDQRLALPSDSYLIDYFNALDDYLEVGPPVFFVASGIDVRSRSNQQLLCGRFSTCDELSLANVLEAERKRSDSSFLAEPPAVWLDDMFQWLNPLLEDCCRVKIKDPSSFCTVDDPDFQCRPCFEGRNPAWNITMEGLPVDQEFMRYLQQWLLSPSDESCPLGGKAPYSSSISLTPDNSAVDLSYFRTYHTPLKRQSDFIDAYAAAERIAADISLRTGADVFPYSIFYVFFDQYSHLVATTREVLTLALVSIFLVTAFFLGSWRTASVLTLTVLMTLVNIMGMMNLFGINLNAVSLVNLVISCGISVEFCAHIARAFMGAKGGGVAFEKKSGSKDRNERAIAALTDVGASVFSGITMTKLIGIFVLGFTRSKLLEVYFFRQWCALIFSGALHGLVFLPVMLSFQGGQGYAFDSEDESWIAGSINNRYNSDQSRPFMIDEDIEDEDDDDDDPIDSRRRRF